MNVTSLQHSEKQGQSTASRRPRAFCVMAFILLKVDPKPMCKYLGRGGGGLKRATTNGCMRQIFGTEILE